MSRHITHEVSSLICIVHLNPGRIWICIVTYIITIYDKLMAYIFPLISSWWGAHCEIRMAMTSFGVQRGGAAEGTPPLQPPKDGDFFRTEATNMFKTENADPGPNPIRTHFGNRENGGQEDAPSCPNENRRCYSAGVGGGHTAATTADGR